MDEVVALLKWWTHISVEKAERATTFVGRAFYTGRASAFDEAGALIARRLAKRRE